MSVFVYPKDFDVLVIGAGHAGIEAVLAAQRLGATVALLTQNLDTIGQMSCNPAVGGIAKGQMVREIDALGGFMALNTDATAIQFRMLNRSKGPSVHSPRAQCDKKAYQGRAKAVIERTERVEIFQGSVAGLLEAAGVIAGAETSLGLQLRAKAVVVSAGTFMGGVLHVGQQTLAGGRMGDAKSNLSDDLRRLGFEVARLKTGTPCRLNGKSINFTACEKQEGDVPPQAFSFAPERLGDDPKELFTLNRWRNETFHVEQQPCWITQTTDRTHAIIRANLDKSPLYSGRIQGTGPRYCPSIEDKVVKFPDKSQHQIFLEPEGRHTEEFYINGTSTSLPYDVQYAFIRSIPGLERAEIIRPGYAVEYDYCPPTQLHPTLETRRIRGLFFAGQINGTSGYEEAAAQGLIAGTNAALQVQGKPAFLLARHEAYIGVLIDDLINKGVTEPYRMFTSRAEHRLLLRHDNADLRLSPCAAEIGLIDENRSRAVEQKRASVGGAIAALRSAGPHGLTWEKWLKRPENGVRDLPGSLLREHPPEVWAIVEIDVKYEGYLLHQSESVSRSRRNESCLIPESIQYGSIPGLKKEAGQALERVRPRTLGQAGRLPAVTPADLALLSILIERERRSDQVREGVK